MKFIELIKKTEWDKIESFLLEYYNKTISNTNEYKVVYNRLLELNSSETRFKIYIEEVFDKNFDDEPYVSITGKDGTLNNESSDFKHMGYDKDSDFANSEINYSLSLTDWKEWLGMDIDDVTIKNYKNYKIISHCLWEMTFYGFDQHTILQHTEELKKREEEEKKKKKKKKKMKLISWEDIEK